VFRTGTFSRLGLFLWLMAVMAVGPMAHRHTTATSADAAAAHSGGHLHDYNGGTIDLDVQDAERADAQGANHSHSDLSLDHLHDSWNDLTTTVVLGIDLFALPVYVDPGFPPQNKPAQLEKPPRITVTG